MTALTEKTLWTRLKQNKRQNGEQSQTGQQNDDYLEEIDDEDEYDSVDCAEYNEWDGITFGPKVLQGISANTIERITKEQMETVLDFYFRNVKENLL